MKKKILYGAGALACLFVAGLAYAAINSGFPFANEQWTGFGSKRGVVQFVLGPSTDGASSNFYPGVTNTNALGTSALRFSNVFTTLLNVSGASTLTGAVSAAGALTVTGTLTANQAVLSVQVSTAPRTSSTIVVTSSGTLAWNSTDGGLCISSGTSQTTMVASSAPATACGH